MTRQNFDTGRETTDFFDKACVTDYRDSFLPHKWKPFGMKLYKCPRCYKLVWVYNIFGVFHGWSCFACMRKIVTRRVPSIQKSVLIYSKNLIVLPNNVPSKKAY